MVDTYTFEEKVGLINELGKSLNYPYNLGLNIIKSEGQEFIKNNDLNSIKTLYFNLATKPLNASKIATLGINMLPLTDIFIGAYNALENAIKLKRMEGVDVASKSIEDVAKVFMNILKDGFRNEEFYWNQFSCVESIFVYLDINFDKEFNVIDEELHKTVLEHFDEYPINWTNDLPRNALLAIYTKICMSIGSSNDSVEFAKRIFDPVNFAILNIDSINVSDTFETKFKIKPSMIKKFVSNTVNTKPEHLENNCKLCNLSKQAYIMLKPLLTEFILKVYPNNRYKIITTWFRFSILLDMLINKLDKETGSSDYIKKAHNELLNKYKKVPGPLCPNTNGKFGHNWFETNLILLDLEQDLDYKHIIF